ncbi:MAG: HlyD family type I secretion periplasmic adaptor subunit [Kiloniellales bacterium]|nr:HlyD family type I secretion periplasmic adaptor subunit [Kiloniellales bacterium]
MSIGKLYDADDLDFVPDLEAAARRRGHRFAYLLTTMVFVFFVTFVAWANFAVLDEVTRGDSTVIPSSKTQVIQNLEGGILAEILVREGDIVDRGDILVRIDNTTAQANFRDARTRHLALLAKTERLRAELEDREPAFPEEVLADAPEAARDEEAQYRARAAQFAAQKAVLESQGQQRLGEVQEMRSRQSQLSRSLGLAREELAITEPLVRKKLMPKVDLLRVQREIADLEGEIRTVKLTIPRLQQAAEEADQRVQEFSLTTKAQISDELSLARTELQSVSEMLFAGEDRVTRTEVRSPVHGTIKEIKHNTVGGVIRPAEDILEIVPLDDTLLVEARIRPADIAFLSPGQNAMVKITAYDFSIYGGLKASLENISADTIKDENGESFYRVYLRTERNKLKHHDRELPIIPGMTASVEILTGQKTVFDYLMKPILKARDRALKER